MKHVEKEITFQIPYDNFMKSYNEFIERLPKTCDNDEAFNQGIKELKDKKSGIDEFLEKMYTEADKNAGITHDDVEKGKQKLMDDIEWSLSHF